MRSARIPFDRVVVLSVEVGSVLVEPVSPACVYHWFSETLGEAGLPVGTVTLMGKICDDEPS